MTDFSQLTDVQIKNYLIMNKVCIVTNCTMLPGSLYLASLKTYINYIPQNNYYVIPGIKQGNAHYGLNAFVDMITTLKRFPFKYVIYIDEDCFISDFRSLLIEFEKFKEGSKYCLAGPQDGGVLSHRNHSSLLINTFISFWDLTTFNNINTNDFISLIKSCDSPNYFKNSINKDTLALMEKLADESINKCKEFRINTFNKETSPYAEVVKNDKSNAIEPNQVPYSVNNDDSYEPYYALLRAIVLLTNKPIYYFIASDYYKEDSQIDNSGLTSVIANSENNNIILYHSWFSRAYNMYMPFYKENHNKRINTIIKNL